MKQKLQIFSNKKIETFFSNFSEYFDITFFELSELSELSISRKNSIVFLDNKNILDKKILSIIKENKEIVILCESLSLFEKNSFSQNNTLVCPMSINKIIDFITEFIYKKKLLLANTVLFNSSITNHQQDLSSQLTDVENYILNTLFREKKIKKTILEKDALKIKKEINSSSLDSHLNRIRKKLKLINSNISISSKDELVFIDFNYQDK